MNTITNTTATTSVILAEMRIAAREAAQDYIRDWTRSTGGNQYGEPMYCGFAWVTVYPQHKGNSREGKEERRVLEAMGFRRDWTGKAYELWNPSGWHGQSMEVKEAGAGAAATVLQRYGFTAYAGSRAD